MKESHNKKKKLSFHNPGIDGIISGKKTKTLRFCEDEDLEPGEVVFLTRQNGDKCGFLEITAKSQVKFCDLTEKDAKPHNWDSLGDLNNMLLSIYPDLQPDSTLTHYTFRYLATAPD